MEYVHYLKPKDVREWRAYAAWLPLSVVAALLLAARFGNPAPGIAARWTGSASLALITTVIGLAIPQGLSLVARVYEKYGSSRVRDILLESLPLTALSLVSFATIPGLLTIAVMGENAPAGLVWWCLGGVMTATVLFFLFLDTVVNFVIREPRPAFLVMERRLAEAVDSGDREAYVENVRGLGDILFYASGSGAQDETVEGVLAAFRINAAAVLASDSPQFGTGRSAGTPASIESPLAEMAWQSARAFMAATDARNDETARRVVSWFSGTLGTIATVPGRTHDAAALLSQLEPMLESAFSDSRTAPQAYVSHGWYFATAFPEAGGSLSHEYSVSYAETAFSLVRRLVAEGRVEPFRGFYAYLSDWVGSDRERPGRVLLEELAFAVMAFALASGRPGLADEMLAYGDRDSGTAVLPAGMAETTHLYLGKWCSSARFRGFGGVGGDAPAKRLAAVLLAARGEPADALTLPEGSAGEAMEMAALATVLAETGERSVLALVSPLPADASERLRLLASRLTAAIGDAEVRRTVRPGIAGLTGRFMRTL